MSNRALDYKYEADGYAYLGTFSVTILGRDIAMPLLNAEGARPDDARELAWDIATTLNMAPEMLEALEEAAGVLTEYIEDAYCDKHLGRGLCDCKTDSVARLTNLLRRVKGDAS